MATNYLVNDGNSTKDLNQIFKALPGTSIGFSTNYLVNNSTSTSKQHQNKL